MTKTIKYARVAKLIAKGLTHYAVGKKLDVPSKVIDRCVEAEDDVEYKPRGKNGNGKTAVKAKTKKAQQALVATIGNGAITDGEALLMIKGVALLEGKPVEQLVREMFEAYRGARKRR